MILFSQTVLKVKQIKIDLEIFVDCPHQFWKNSQKKHMAYTKNFWLQKYQFTLES